MVCCLRIICRCWVGAASGVTLVMCRGLGQRPRLQVGRGRGRGFLQAPCAQAVPYGRVEDRRAPAWAAATSCARRLTGAPAVGCRRSPRSKPASRRPRRPAPRWTSPGAQRLALLRAPRPRPPRPRRHQGEAVHRRTHRHRLHREALGDQALDELLASRPHGASSSTSVSSLAPPPHHVGQLAARRRCSISRARTTPPPACQGARPGRAPNSPWRGPGRGLLLSHPQHSITLIVGVQPRHLVEVLTIWLISLSIASSGYIGERRSGHS